MSAIEELKKELIKQKERIIAKGGTVVVENLNPSPSEITKGIDTISAVDFSQINVGSEDVSDGKKFYAQDGTLKIGTNKLNQKMIEGVFMFEENVNDGQFYSYEIDSAIKKIHKSAFENNANNVTIKMHSNISEIGEKAFAGTDEFSFENFNDMSNLARIGSKAFYKSKMGGVNVEEFCVNVQEIGDSAFENADISYADFKLMSGILQMGNNVFRQDKTSYQNTLDLSDYKLSSTMEGTFYYQFFDCDFIAPPTLKTIGQYFNYNGGFNNIIIPETVMLLDDYCFGADEDKPVGYFYLRSVEFLAQEPPQIGVGAFAAQLANRDFKIYVPDDAVEKYKSVANLTAFINKIVPASQKN